MKPPNKYSNLKSWDFGNSKKQIKKGYLSTSLCNTDAGKHFHDVLMPCLSSDDLI